MLYRARGFGALSVAIGLLFVGCGGDSGAGGDDDEGGAAGSAGSSSGKGGGGGKAGKGGSAGSAGSGAGNGGTSGGGGGSGTGGSSGRGGDAGAPVGQGGASAGDGGDANVGGEANVGGGASAGESSGGDGSGGDVNEGGASGEAASGGQSTGGDGNGAGGAGGDGVTGGDGGSDEAGGAAGSGNTPVIVVFDGGTANTGATFSGRAGLDALCLTAKNTQSIPGGTPHALISVSAADDIADFPTLYGLPANRPFASFGGNVIADDFADLLDGTIDMSLEAAGVLLGEPGLWFTGSNADGTASANTCEGWTTTQHSTVSPRANYGYTGNTNSWWLDGSSTATCAASQYHVLCVTWE